MRSNFEKFGANIRLVDQRNHDLKCTLLLGLSIDKQFIPSVANTIGTDMANYKVVSRNQFACSLMQVRRDKKIPVAIYDGNQSAIISPAYPVFEVVNTAHLLPEYLMMWMLRSEFDREACFYAVGGVRGSLEWEDFCNMELPVPSIEKQREIVKEYQVIVDRIALNEQLNQKLEEAAQAIYKHWFVDFEFPMTAEHAAKIGKPELEGQPYKSNGGEMVFNEVLEKDIPKGWELIRWDNLCNIASSRRVFFDQYVPSGVPFYRGKEIIIKQNCKPLAESLYIDNEKFLELSKKNGAPSNGDILMTAVGTLGVSYLVGDEEFYFKDGNILWLKDFKNDSTRDFVYAFLKSREFGSKIKEITIGSTQKAITIDTLKEQHLVYPDRKTLEHFSQTIKPIVSYSSLCKGMCTPYELLKRLFLSRVTLAR